MKKGAGVIDADAGDVFVKTLIAAAAACLTRGQPGGGLSLSSVRLLLFARRRESVLLLGSALHHCCSAPCRFCFPEERMEDGKVCGCARVRACLCHWMCGH